MSKNLVNAKEILDKANLYNYAIAQINVCNLEWTKWVLESAQETNTPIIIAVSEAGVRHMGGYLTVYSMVNALVEDLKLTVPVALHLDNGTFEGCQKALDAGFTSVMYNGIKLDYETNISQTSQLSKMCEEHNAALEVEIGCIGNFEGEYTDEPIVNISKAKQLLGLVDSLAINCGSYSADYPENPELDFKLLVEINNEIKKPLTLRGINGFSDATMKKAVSLGVNKLNIATDLHLKFALKNREYISTAKDLDYRKKGYDIRQIFQYASPAIKKICTDKFLLTSSFGAARK